MYSFNRLLRDALSTGGTWFRTNSSCVHACTAFASVRRNALETVGQCVAAIGIRCIYVTRLSVSRRLLVAIIAPCSDSHIVYLLYLEKKTSYGAMFTLTLCFHILQPVQLHLAPIGARRPACRFPEGYWTSQDRGKQSDLEITFRVLRFWAEISTRPSE